MWWIDRVIEGVHLACNTGRLAGWPSSEQDAFVVLLLRTLHDRVVVDAVHVAVRLNGREMQVGQGPEPGVGLGCEGVEADLGAAKAHQEASYPVTEGDDQPGLSQGLGVSAWLIAGTRLLELGSMPMIIMAT